MNLRSGCLAALLPALLVLGSSCSHRAGDHPRRLAILPPEVLINEPSSQWLSLTLPLVWEEDLATAPDLVVLLARDTSAAYRSGASEVLQAIVENRQGRLRLSGTITDTSTQRNLRVLELENGSFANVLPLANAFAKRLDRGASSFSTGNEKALQLFAGGLQAKTLEARIQGLNEAISNDPSFGLAYIALAEAEAQSNPAGLPDLLTKAGQHTNSFTALDRAKFNTLAAQAVHAPILQQRIALHTLLQLAPNTLDALAQLGSLCFLQGDATNGESLMARALELSPGNPGVLQQLGRGLIETRQFAEAEKILTSLENNLTILPALATCILLEGDAKRAAAVSDRFSRSLQPEFQVIYDATWLALSGNVAGAITALEGRRFSGPGLQSAALAELVIWHSMQKDFAGAKATLLPAAGAPGAFAPESLLLSRADAPVGDWMGMVQSARISADQRQSVLAYGLFLGGHYDQSTQYWQQILGRSGGTDLPARAMLAGSLDRSGHPRAALKSSLQPFVPEFGDLYAAVSFNEMRRLLNLQVR